MVRLSGPHGELQNAALNGWSQALVQGSPIEVAQVKWVEKTSATYFEEQLSTQGQMDQ